MELIYAALKPYHIKCLNKQFPNVNLKNFFHDIDEQCLINILKYRNFKIETKTKNKSNHWDFELGCRHKNPISRRKTNSDTFRSIQKTGTPEGHWSMTSKFNVINKCYYTRKK